MRLDKFLAEASIGTRKTARIYIKEGNVEVNGQILVVPAAEIKEDTDRILCFGKEVIHTGKQYYMLYKPAGCITARQDERQRTVMDCFDSEMRKLLFPVGRLDKDTEGLLLLTNDGEFNHRLMYPDQHVEKTYFFWAYGSLSDKELEILQKGVSIGDGKAPACAEKITIMEQGIYDCFQEQIDLSHLKKVKKIPPNQPVVSGTISISEGRKHQVKRMLRAVGCRIVYLKRISIGAIRLDDTLQRGEFRKLTIEEIQSV